MLLQITCILLTLGELGSTACTFESIFFPFLHSRVTSEESGLLESGTESLVVLEKSTGKAVTDSASLSCNAAAVYTANNVKLLCCACEGKRLTNNKLKGFKSEIIVDISVVDCYITCSGIYTNSCDRFLSAAA